MSFFLKNKYVYLGIISIFISIMAIMIYGYKVHTLNLVNREDIGCYFKDQSRSIKKKIKSKYFDLKGEIPFPLQDYSADNPESDRVKTIIVSHYTLDNKYIKSVIKNHLAYAKQHGYSYWFRNGIIDGYFLDLNDPKVLKVDPNLLYWQKLAAIKQAMDLLEGDRFKYTWIMWVDGDAVFTNFNQSMTDLISQAKVTTEDYLVIARDMSCDKNNNCFTCLNAGVFLIKNNLAGRNFITKTINSFASYFDYNFPEQNAMEDLIFNLKMKVPSNSYCSYKKLFKNYNKCTCSLNNGIIVTNSRFMNSGYNHKNLWGRWYAGDFIAHFAGNKHRDNVIPTFLNCLKNHSQKLNLCENIN